LQASIDDYLTVYPNLNASVKDVKDKEGKVTVATAKMLTANKGKSRLGASVSIKFSQEFANNVSWQKIDERTGAPVEDEDIIDGELSRIAEGLHQTTNKLASTVPMWHLECLPDEEAARLCHDTVCE